MIHVTQENKAICDKCGLTVVVDKVEYIQGQVPLLSRPPNDWTVITHKGHEVTLCPEHKVELRGQMSDGETKLIIDGETFHR